MAMTMKRREIGRVKKMAKLPPEMVRAWRREFSARFPRTNAKTRGTIG
jgi:hypothetical protein